MCDCISQQDFSSSNLNENGCPLIIPGTCAIYTGVSIPSMNINTNDTLDSVIRKIAIFLNALSLDVEDLAEEVAIIGGETTSSTTTTTTTGSGTTSTTTTTTTTSSGISSNVYVLAKSGSTTPTSGEILAGEVSVQDETADVIVDLTSFNASPLYCFVAIKRNGTNSIKNKWAYETNPSSLNNIGTVDDLWNASVTVSVSGVNYDVYPTNYATQFAENLIFKHV